jgi:hypothetical protein
MLCRKQVRQFNHLSGVMPQIAVTQYEIIEQKHTADRYSEYCYLPSDEEFRSGFLYVLEFRSRFAAEYDRF